MAQCIWHLGGRDFIYVFSLQLVQIFQLQYFISALQGKVLMNALTGGNNYKCESFIHLVRHIEEEIKIFVNVN